MTTYDDAYMRAHLDALRDEDKAALADFRACHRLTRDEQDNLAAWTAHTRPELIRYRIRLETPPCTTTPMTSTPTNAPSPAMTPARIRISTRSIDGHPPMTAFAPFSGSLSSPCPTPASPSSSGRSGRRWRAARALVALLTAKYRRVW